MLINRIKYLISIILNKYDIIEYFENNSISLVVNMYQPRLKNYITITINTYLFRRDRTISTEHKNFYITNYIETDSIDVNRKNLNKFKKLLYNDEIKIVVDSTFIKYGK